MSMCFRTLLLVVLAGFLNTVVWCNQVFPQVATNYGVVRGNGASRSRGGREFYQFLGIPYAKPPVGDLRFEPPQRPEPWEGIRMAARQRPTCLQFNYVTGFLAGDEDCLYLNVFVPRIGAMTEQLDGTLDATYRNVTTLLPVMVYIYGGGWMYGSAEVYGAHYFMDEDVVLVTFNYRVGALGFLNTGDGNIRGNMGLKDQNAVLRWIQENIMQFGGDPLRVTIFGQSAGASAVHYHMLSPMSRGLFHKAISQSGTALRINQFVTKPMEQARRFAGQVECTRTTMDEMVECLKEVDGKTIARTHVEIANIDAHPLALYAATAEPVIDENTFLASSPLEIVHRGEYNHVPWMTGVVSEDGLNRIAEILKHYNLTRNINYNWNTVAPGLLDYDSKMTKVAEKVQQFYLPFRRRRERRNHFARDIREFTKMFSDRYYFTATRYSALQHAKHAPTYLYYYSYPGEFTFFSVFISSGLVPKIVNLKFQLALTWAREHLLGKSRRLGVCHSDDVAMLFPIKVLSNINRNEEDYRMSVSMVKTWADFATYDSENLEFQKQYWPKINPNEESNLYMKLHDTQSRLIREPFTTRAKFWENMNLIG